MADWEPRPADSASCTVKDGSVTGLIPESELFAIHYPGYPSSTSRAVETLSDLSQITKIHSRRINVHGDVNFEELARSTDDFNGAQLKAVCVEVGMLALRRDATEVTHEDFNEGIIQVQAKKKFSLNYYA